MGSMIEAQIGVNGADGIKGLRPSLTQPTGEGKGAQSERVLDGKFRSIPLFA